MASYWFIVDYFLMWKMEPCHNVIWAQQIGGSIVEQMK